MPQKDFHFRRDQILQALETELDRSIRDLTVEEFGPPYFLSYAVKDYESVNVNGERGSLFDSHRERNRTGYAEIRVGDYAMDNTIDGFLDIGEQDGPNPDNSMPLDDNPEALRYALWRLTDQKYKEALRRYLSKRGRMLHEAFRNQDLPDFSREQSNRHLQEPLEVSWRMKEWEEFVRRTSARLGRHSSLIHSKVEVRVAREGRYYINSEGARLFSDSLHYTLQASAITLAKDGMPLRNFFSGFGRTLEDLPDEAEFCERLEEMVEELHALHTAEVMEPYSGPTLLSPQAAGVFFHEAIGHRLEGERQISDMEGQTFRGRLGERILPEFLTIYDDPKAQIYDGKYLFGSYDYDDEGVAAQRALLVERGILRDFLRSRTPVEGFLTSNGHGRHGFYEDPMARMSNLFVESSNGRSDEDLKAMLLEEVERQQAPFGLHIVKVEGGETSTSRYDLQGFSGSPVLVFKILPSGESILVRGAEFIGTPLVSASKILAAGQTASAFHGYCGAESGWIPVSTICPAVLLTEMELQRSKTRNLNPPILPEPG